MLNEVIAWDQPPMRKLRILWEISKEGNSVLLIFFCQHSAFPNKFMTEVDRGIFAQFGSYQWGFADTALILKLQENEILTQISLSYLRRRCPFGTRKSNVSERRGLAGYHSLRFFKEGKHHWEIIKRMAQAN